MNADIDGHLLDILCCPITRRSLKRFDDASLGRLNAAIAGGEVRNHGGNVLTEPLDAALVTTEGDLVYPLRDGVPVLFEEECIHWAAYR
ncbi:MAG: hypothetical protein HKN56_00195 [Gammaproteobacteria bacterium]|nr:hypothetical protein [Gammaproteobacteria bacterium]NND53375.1 hypothetical protein [Gammaproteobacteria bacterium]